MRRNASGAWTVVMFAPDARGALFRGQETFPALQLAARWAARSIRDAAGALDAVISGPGVTREIRIGDGLHGRVCRSSTTEQASDAIVAAVKEGGEMRRNIGVWGDDVKRPMVYARARNVDGETLLIDFDRVLAKAGLPVVGEVTVSDVQHGYVVDATGERAKDVVTQLAKRYGSDLSFFVESGDPWGYRPNGRANPSDRFVYPLREGTDTYVSTYCNSGHDLRTGRPIDHECIIIPPAALRAEADGDVDLAIEIMQKAKRLGRAPVVRGRARRNARAGGGGKAVRTVTVDITGPGDADEWLDEVDAVLGSVAVGMKRPASNMVRVQVPKQKWRSEMLDALRDRGLDAHVDPMASEFTPGWSAPYARRRNPGHAEKPMGADAWDPETGTALFTWFERDRAHVELRDIDTDKTIIEWWDDDVAEAVDDGFLDPRDWLGSAIEYANHLGVIGGSRRSKRRNPCGTRHGMRHN